MAPGGTLLVIAAVRDAGVPVGPTGTWPLRHDEVEPSAANHLIITEIEQLSDLRTPAERRWRATHQGPEEST